MASTHSHAVTAALPAGAEEFTLIKGIGPGIAGHLYEAGIHTFAQLAALSPAEVAALLPSFAGLSAERISKQDWIGQARALASTHEREIVEAPQETATLTGRQHYATFTAQLLLDEGNDVRRIRVVHIQTGVEKTWADWDGERLVRFLVEQAPLHLPPTEPALAHEPEPAISLPTTEPVISHEPETEPPPPHELVTGLRLDVSEALIHEIPLEQNASGPPFVKRIRAEVNFQLSGTAAEQIASGQPHYFIQLLACNLTSHQTAVLAADQGQLQPELLAYTATVEFPLPSLGHYQLFGMIMLPENNTSGVAFGPVLNVVP